MYVMPYSRNNSLFGLFDELERNFFNSSVSGSSGFRTDISERENFYLLEAELPGFDRGNIEVELKEDILTISACNETENENSDGNDRYLRRERRYGSYSRSFNVDGIDTSAIKADYKNGVLQVVLPKIAKAQPTSRRIEIGETTGTAEVLTETE